MASTPQLLPIDVNSAIEIHASPKAVFAQVTDHVGTPGWVHKVRAVSMVRQGTPENGKGAIRKVNFKPLLWSTVEEEIVQFEQDSHFHYSIISKMPGLVRHLGVFELTPQENGNVQLAWKVHFSFRKGHWFRFFAKSFARQFKKIQEEGLAELKRQLEA